MIKTVRQYREKTIHLTGVGFVYLTKKSSHDIIKASAGHKLPMFA
jgi:hypothetical protein